MEVILLILLCCHAAPRCSGGERQLGALADHVVEMVAAQQDAARDSALVHAVPWLERAAGALLGKSETHITIRSQSVSSQRCALQCPRAVHPFTCAALACLPSLLHPLSFPVAALRSLDPPLLSASALCPLLQACLSRRQPTSLPWPQWQAWC